MPSKGISKILLASGPFEPNHFKEFKATKTLLSYILPVNFLIDHLSIKFINHIVESLAEVDFNITGKSLIKKVLDIVISTKYQEMKSSCHHDLENSEFMFIPIGKIVQQLFQDQKPMEYFNFLKTNVSTTLLKNKKTWKWKKKKTILFLLLSSSHHLSIFWYNGCLWIWIIYNLRVLCQTSKCRVF